jgi:hypothetical protein
MLRILKQYLLSLSLVFMAVNANAERWSYVYIQGDKQIPFYVKLEGEMLPRFSKNYYIIPELGPGPIDIQILFQQNEYPPQNFKILVPEAGFRGFLLTKKDNTFALYDIHQKFYLMPGEAGEDHLPEILPVTASAAKTPPPVAAKVEPKKSTPKKAEPKQKKTENKEPEFIENIELSNEHAAEETPAPPPVNRPVIREEPVAETRTAPSGEEDYRQTEAQVNLTDNAAPILNSDCPEPMGDEEFDKIYTNAQQKSAGQKRISYLLEKVKNNCYSTRQAYFLARQLSSESMRYSFLKRVYPRITDQHNFHLLESNLFTTLEWKSYFRLIQ